MTQVVEKHSPWLTALEERLTSGPAWLEELRSRGAARFAALGFPTVRNEEWRFTNVAPIARAELSPAPAVAVDDAQLAAFPYSDAALRLVFVNGRFSSSLSRTPGLPTGVTAGSLATAFESDPRLEELFGRDVDMDTRAFAALNTAFAVDGAYLSLPDGVVLETPIHVLFVSVSPAGGPGAAAGTMSHPRTLIVLGANSQARVVESYVGLPGQPYLANAVTEV